MAAETANPSGELRKVLTLLYSHKAVAGVTFGELMDREGSSHGFYTEEMEPKPEVYTLDELWQAEWNSSWTGLSFGADEWVDGVDAYHGIYEYTYRHEGRSCTGMLALQRGAQDWAKKGADGEAQPVYIVCDDDGRGHVSTHAAPVPPLAPSDASEASEAANEALMQLLARMRPPSAPPLSKLDLFSELVEEIRGAYFSQDGSAQRVLLAAVWVPSTLCTLLLCCALCCVGRRMRRTTTMLLREQALRAEAEMENRVLIAQHGGVSSPRGNGSRKPRSAVGVVANVARAVDNVVDVMASKAGSVTTGKDKKMPKEVTISTTSEVELREFT